MVVEVILDQTQLMQVQVQLTLEAVEAELAEAVVLTTEVLVDQVL